jgi:Transposase DDE domain
MAADGGRRGYQLLLDEFWEECRSNEIALPVDKSVSAAAFCNARKKLDSTAVRQLLRDVSSAFDRCHGARHRLKGRRVLAVDGSRFSLQRAPELWTEFGAPTNGYTPQVSVSVLFDVIAKMPIDATITPFASSERDQVEALLSSTHAGDIIVLDRGFPSYALIDLLIEHGLDFVIRMQLGTGFHEVKEFVQSGQREADIVLDPGRYHPPLKLPPRKLRVVRRDGPKGEPQVFLTTLARREFRHQTICDLYRRRWQIELFFRLEKSDYVGQQQFHAKHVQGIKQEVFAFLLFIAITRALMAAAAKTHRAPYERIAQKAAIMAIAGHLTTVLLASDRRRAREILAGLLTRIAARRDPPPRQRSCQRRSFKPRSRWGADGHVNDSARARRLR